MRRILFPVLVGLVSMAVGYHIVILWKGTRLSQVHLSKENLVRAIRLNPSNPDPSYRLALFHQLDFSNVDLEKSLAYLKKAIERNPLEQQYYLNLARVFLRMGKRDLSEGALEKAVRVFPTGYQGRWISGNLLLQQGDVEKALPHFSYILSYYPNQSSLVFDVLLRTTQDTDFLLEKVVPKDPSSLRHYLAYLYEIGDKESAKKAWEKRSLYGLKSNRQETLRHIEFLIRHGDVHEAFRVWESRLLEEGIPIPSDGNLVTNAGFEKEEILGGSFDWKITKVRGAEVSFDSTAIEGKRSLKIVFDGKENIDFYHVSQYVVLKPDRDYVLRVRMKTKAVTTKSGPKIEIVGVGSSFRGSSEPLNGDNDWREVAVSFRTAPNSQGGLLRLRREKTDKFDRFISGTVWLDDVQLREKSR